MRIISWNCGAGFHRKIEALLALSPDVAVVQECADLDSVARKAPEFAPTSAQWTGDNLYKGLGVFSFGPYRLSPVGAADASITYAIPARVVGPSAFNLVALSSHYGKSRVSVAEPGPTMRALRAHASFLAKRPSIMAGDLNNHVRWDKRGKTSNHANAVAELAALGLASAYHSFYGFAQGSERHPTLYWRDRTRTGPTFHVDYVLVPHVAIGLLRRVAIGSYVKWIATGLSDHAPLIVDFSPEFAAVVVAYHRGAEDIRSTLCVSSAYRSAKRRLDVDAAFLINRFFVDRSARGPKSEPRARRGAFVIWTCRRSRRTVAIVPHSFGEFPRKILKSTCSLMRSTS